MDAVFFSPCAVGVLGFVGFVPAVCRRERDLPADLQKLLSVKRIFHVPQCGDLKLIFYAHTHTSLGSRYKSDLAKAMREKEEN